MVRLSEIYLDAANLSHYDNFNLPDCNIVWAEHPLNTKRQCLVLLQFLQERIKYETNIADKTCNFSSLFRFLIQSKHEFESYADKLELNFDSVDIRNTCFIVVFGEFNAQTK